MDGNDRVAVYFYLGERNFVEMPLKLYSVIPTFQSEVTDDPADALLLCRHPIHRRAV